MAQSSHNPSFLENSGSMSKTSDANVWVYSKDSNNDDDSEGDGGPGPSTTHPGGSGNGNGNDSGHNSGSRPGSNNGHGKGTGSQVGMQSVRNVNGDNTPVVVVDDYGHNKFPQTGSANDHLVPIGISLMIGTKALIGQMRRIKVF